MSFFLRILISALLVFLAEYYFYKKFTKAAETFIPSIDIKKFKRKYLYVILYLNIFPVALIVSFIYTSLQGMGRIVLPETLWFDYLIMFPFWISLLIQAQAILLMLPLDLFLLIFNFFDRIKKKIFLAKYYIFSGILSISIVYVPLRIFYDYKNVDVRKINYYKENLHPDLEGFKVVHISDIQADRYNTTERIQNYIEIVNLQNPDLVLISGDIITSTPNYIELAAENLGKVKSVHGTFTCLGDHDHWAYREDTKKSIRELTTALAKHNVWMIDNNKFNFKIGEATLGVTFVTNTYVDRIDKNELDSLTNLQIKNDFNILSVHQPSRVLAELASNKNYELMLAGHTHGGQITFLFPFLNLSPTHLETMYAQGSFYFGDMIMHVNRGLGMSVVPIRLNSTPEVTVFTLKNK